jgi:hypothetical protein
VLAAAQVLVQPTAEVKQSDKPRKLEVDSQTTISRTSLALANVRGFTIFVIVTFHSLFAYMAYNPAPHPRYYPPPLISDSSRWIGFDLICASQYVYMMQFMFLLSGLFVWPSLVRRGAVAFVRRRVVRLGIPFVLGVYLMMPLAHVPIYLLNNVAPTWSGFWTEWLALDFWPSGHLWFLWCLLVLDISAAALCVFVPGAAGYVRRLSALGKQEPMRYLSILVTASAVAYVPLSAIYEPWEWVHWGPFGFQPSFVLLYIVYFYAGIGVGVFGIDKSFFSAAGRKFAHTWARWLMISLLGFIAWITATAVSAGAESSFTSILQGTASLGFSVASAAACFTLAAIFLRYWNEPSLILGMLSEHAYGIYFFHYGFVLLLQYALLDLPLVAPIKVAIVIFGTLLLSLVASRVVAATRFDALMPNLERVRSRRQ